ncbi:MAG: hypothetical protein RJS98_04070, partial [Rhodospirillaceae bacterium]
MGELKPQDLYVKRKVKNSWYVHVPGKDFYCKCDSEGSADLVLSSLNTRTLPDQEPDDNPIVWISSDNVRRVMIATPEERAQVVACKQEGFDTPLYARPQTLPDQVCMECATKECGNPVANGNLCEACNSGGPWYAIPSNRVCISRGEMVAIKETLDLINADTHSDMMQDLIDKSLAVAQQALSTKPEADRETK